MSDATLDFVSFDAGRSGKGKTVAISLTKMRHFQLEMSNDVHLKVNKNENKNRYEGSPGQIYHIPGL